MCFFVGGNWWVAIVAVDAFVAVDAPQGRGIVQL